uniref:Uncharacterized protein n=1 Tax=Eucampia antarctica TaxID=49252 RepID=A0A6U0T1I4_9STRA|mmetsp:Transcript_4227/g.4009  ORF Transcript_4227/g.4009 Transcript_4227/m.4009 type:complete len:207 (+) Transcript_4227:63-683(+)|eukprot:CAMPEP_0197832368 /NCGR_PEP_ID=MMETSP1437-20131217/14451_1 /TAXON_ID=49252 ORGANISM="Eucampia antarctica, Strain CCMP1452" /NCGR_SAMPLE_ID=MMETSP1437 /ASSEMBLY_ACC=CAM_ASM_001096 /LENGTH=206 /DNA_ID=CAMNT_0043435715 /DNA_START=61 /DNA_END=681 /DNA_ORIENTATION=+
MGLVRKMHKITFYIAIFLLYCGKLSAEETSPENKPTGRVKYIDIDPDNEEQYHDLEAKDWKGKTKRFENFEGYVTVVLNMQWNWSTVRANLMKIEHIHSLYPYVSEFMVFPTNIPCTGDDELTMREKTLTELYDWKINIMETVKINGDDTHPVFKYLKRVFEVENLNENYATYFFISPDGDQISKVDGAAISFIQQGVNEYVKKYI